MCPTINDTHGARGTRAVRRNETGAQACNGIYYENSRNYRRRRSPAIRLCIDTREGTRIMQAVTASVPVARARRRKIRPVNYSHGRARKGHRVQTRAEVHYGRCERILGLGGSPEEPRARLGHKTRFFAVALAHSIPREYVASELRCREYLSSTSPSRHAEQEEGLGKVSLKKSRMSLAKFCRNSKRFTKGRLFYLGLAEN